MFPSLMAYFIIPAYTLLFVSNTNWFSLNLSVIGNRYGYSQAFILLGALIGTYFYVVLGKVIRSLPAPKHPDRLLDASLFLLFFAVSTPYLPSLFPVRSFLHVVSAFLAAALLLVCLYLTVWQLADQTPRLFSVYRRLLVLLTLACAILLVLVRIVSTALEVVFLLGATVMVEKLYAHRFQAPAESDDRRPGAIRHEGQDGLSPHVEAEHHHGEGDA